MSDIDKTAEDHIRTEYTEILSYPAHKDIPELHVLRLKVEQQSFKIFDAETIEEVNWMQRQLVLALTKLIKLHLKHSFPNWATLFQRIRQIKTGIVGVYLEHFNASEGYVMKPLDDSSMICGKYDEFESAEDEK